MSLYDKKTKGIYYTPKIIVDYILEELLINYDIIKNPEPKILDLSCGCGNFLLEAFDILYKLIKTNLKAINEKYGEHYIDNISTHIITKCIYGTDLDTNAIEILKETLVEKKRFYDNQKYDFFINIALRDLIRMYYIKNDKWVPKDKKLLKSIKKDDKNIYDILKNESFNKYEVLLKIYKYIK